MSKSAKAGLLLATLFILAAALLFFSHIYSVNTNAADSGESAISFFMLTLPWMNLWSAKDAAQWVTYGAAWFCIGINALILQGVGYLSGLALRLISFWFRGIAGGG